MGNAVQCIDSNTAAFALLTMSAVYLCCVCKLGRADGVSAQAWNEGKSREIQQEAEVKVAVWLR